MADWKEISLARERKVRHLALIIFACFFVFPILVMANCSGWNEGSMEVSACYLDFQFFRSLADFLYGFILFSAFTVGLPIVLYGFVTWWLSKRLAELVLIFQSG
jgi:hypothetical protein